MNHIPNQLPEGILVVTFDTTRAPTAEELLRTGAAIINDLRTLDEIDDATTIEIHQIVRGSDRFEPFLRRHEMKIKAAAVAIVLIGIWSDRPSATAPEAENLRASYGATNVHVAGDYYESTLPIQNFASALTPDLDIHDPKHGSITTNSDSLTESYLPADQIIHFKRGYLISSDGKFTFIANSGETVAIAGVEVTGEIPQQIPIQVALRDKNDEMRLIGWSTAMTSDAPRDSRKVSQTGRFVPVGGHYHLVYGSGQYFRVYAPFAMPTNFAVHVVGNAYRSSEGKPEILDLMFIEPLPDPN